MAIDHGGARRTRRRCRSGAAGAVTRAVVRLAPRAAQPEEAPAGPGALIAAVYAAGAAAAEGPPGRWSAEPAQPSAAAPPLAAEVQRPAASACTRVARPRSGALPPRQARGARH